MRVLHIAPHLGGGIGKAHSSLQRALPRSIKRTFFLLEWPIEKRYLRDIQDHGARVILSDLNHIVNLSKNFDIVQFEYINHPKILQCMARCEFDAIRSVVWAHVSGLHRPILQPAMFKIPHIFLFSSPVSCVLATDKKNVGVINSGYGFPTKKSRKKRSRRTISYLGTVDFVKMHNRFFEAVARMNHPTDVFVWGKANGEIKKLASDMKNVRFMEETNNPQSALLDSDIFFYPLQPKHYGTGENSLVEAMDCGLVPVVLNNPAESQIVEHEQSGLIAKSIEQCTNYLDTLMWNDELYERLSKGAVDRVMKTRRPEYSANEFSSLWYSLMELPAAPCNFASAIGTTPAEWFLSTQCLPGQTLESIDHLPAANKGRLAHFAKAFPGDESLKPLQEVG